MKKATKHTSSTGKMQKQNTARNFFSAMSPREQERIVMQAIDESIKDQQAVLKRSGMKAK